MKQFLGASDSGEDNSNDLFSDDEKDFRLSFDYLENNVNEYDKQNQFCRTKSDSWVKIALMSMSLIINACKSTVKLIITMDYQEIMHQRTSIAVFAVKDTLKNYVYINVQGQEVRSFKNLKELELNSTTILIMKNLHVVEMAPMVLAVELKAFDTSKESRLIPEWVGPVVQVNICAIL